MKRAASHQEHIDRLNIAVKVDNISVTYDGKPVLLDINLEIPSGAVMALIGPNNAGKTTLLKTILGLIKPHMGKVYIFSRPALTLRNDTAWIPEKSSVDWSFPTTVYDVAVMGSYNRLKLKEKPKKSDKELTLEALEKTGLIDLRKKPIGEISNSHRQRLLIARALVQNPRIYVMDEPFFTADDETSAIVLNIVDDLKKTGKTVIASHHDILTTPAYFDMAALLNVRIITAGSLNTVFQEEAVKSAYGNKSDFIKILAPEINDAK